MIPQRFRDEQKEKVAIPSDVQRLFSLYEQHNRSEVDLISLLQNELGLHSEWSGKVRGKVLEVIKRLQRSIDARAMCKSETGISAVPTRRETKIKW